jgi:hypothetical protein
VETNIAGIFTETLTTNIEVVLADQTSTVSANTTMIRKKILIRNFSFFFEKIFSKNFESCNSIQYINQPNIKTSLTCSKIYQPTTCSIIVYIRSGPFFKIAQKPIFFWVAYKFSTFTFTMMNENTMATISKKKKQNAIIKKRQLTIDESPYRRTWGGSSKRCCEPW